MDEVLEAKEDRGEQLDARRAAGPAAPEAAGSPFADYRSGKAENTTRRQDAALDLFARFLSEQVGMVRSGDDLAKDPEAWYGISWHMVDGFVAWMLQEGYAIGTVNARLSTVRIYARLAAEGGVIRAEELAMIENLSGYGQADGKLIDKKRIAAGIPTRVGDKKAEPVALSRSEMDALRSQPDTPQGRRDAVLVSLMLDLGLRLGEVAGLVVDQIHLDAGELSVYRPTIGEEQTLRLEGRLFECLTRYVSEDALASGPLLRASRKDGSLTHAGMTNRAISKRVGTLGKQIGLEDLSAQDLRHTWATWAARDGMPFDRLKEAGGWSSPAMPLRYFEGHEMLDEGEI